MKQTYLAVLLVCVLGITVSPVEASSVEVSTAVDKLDIGEAFGGVIQSFTSSHLSELSGGTISTSKGKTDYDQFLTFTGLNYPYTTLKDNDNNVVTDYLFIDDGAIIGDAFFQYDLEFIEGLQSEISGETISDVTSKKVKIFNEEYTIVSATTSGSKIVLDFATGAAIEFFEEGDEKTFSINGKEYAITLTLVDTAQLEAAISVDGVDLPSPLAIGETQELSDGTIIGVSKILINSGSSNMAELFLGAKIIRFEDSNYQDTSYEQNVDVNKEKINKGFVKIEATKSGSELSVNKISYRLIAVDEVYIGVNEGLQEQLGSNSKKGLLANWDITYEGLSETSMEKITFSPQGGNKEYELSFKNANGNSFTSIPFVFINGDNFGLGDLSSGLVIQEGTEIAENDYFIITNSNTHSGLTYVMRYVNFDNQTQTVTFHDYSTNSDKSFSYTESGDAGILGTGTVIVGSLSAAFSVLDSANNPIKVDLNTDGSIATDIVNIVTAGGGILVSTVPSAATHEIKIKTDASMFEENSTDEEITFTFETRGGAVGIQNTFSGITTEGDGTDTKGLSNYGVYMLYSDPGASDPETLSFDYPQQQRFAVANIVVNAVSTTTSQVIESEEDSTCDNNVQDGDETDTDCGGSCSACSTTPAQSTATCGDGIKNQDETEVDCGGSCSPCQIKTKCPNACLYIGPDNLDICLSAGERIEEVYCTKDYKIALQKSNGLGCTDDYECMINICEKNECGKHVTFFLVILNILVVLGLFVILYLLIDVILDRK